MIKVFKYNNSPVQFEEINGQVMANATLMCQAFNKRFNDWSNLATTKRYFEAITKKNGNCDIQLVVTKTGSSENGGGSWIHEKLILSLARWLEVDFELWCDEKIAELLRTGQTAIAKPQTTLDILKLTIQGLEEQQRGLEEVKQEVLELKAKTATRPDYFTVIGYATFNQIKIGLQLASKIGQKAARICKENGYPTDDVPDPRFGRVKSYPKTVLQQVFSEAVC